MILRSKSVPRLPAQPQVAVASPPPMPDWLRRAIISHRQTFVGAGASQGADQGGGFDDVALIAGAALAALDAVVRREERSAGAWRQRLALAAAAVTARQAGRVEDETALRDAMLLTRPGDEVGPGGRIFLGWRQLASRPAMDLLTGTSIGAMLEEFGFCARDDDEIISGLADELHRLRTGSGMAGMMTGAFTAAERHGFGRSVGAWLADALLAQRLGWSHAIPLLGAQAAMGASGRRRRPAAGFVATSLVTTGLVTTGMETDQAQAKTLLAAQAHAALRAVDLSVDLARRAERLLAVAPKLRAKAADKVVERILSDDALVASERIVGISDRGLRRLFDRLVELGAVRELTGRPTFRIYGL